MSDGITDGTYQSKIPEINLKRTTEHKNVYADTAIYQVMATFGAETIQIFEADNKERAQAFIDSIVSNGYLKALNPTLNIVYVNHSIIEDGYYTYSHIYENGQTINFTIYNTPLTYNVADVIQGWQGYVVQFSTDVSHWWYDNHAYAYSADGTDRFTNVFPNLNLLDGTKDFSGDWINNWAWPNDGTYKGLTVKSTQIGWNGMFKKYIVPQNGLYTWSSFVKSESDTSNIFRVMFINNKEFPIVGLGHKFDWLRDSVTISLKKGDEVIFNYGNSENNGGKLSVAGYKLEHGSIATLYMQSASEVQPSDYPQFIGTQHTPIGYLHDDPKWYDWQPFTGTLPLQNTHTEFSFSTKLWDTIEEIKAIAPINKRNIRNDNWKYQPNETYPFIGGYES